MVLNGFDSVKVFSIGNYSRRRKLKWLFEFFVLLSLVLHQASLFSLAGPVIRHFFRQLVVVFNSHIFVFVVFHAMLFVVYSLSHLTDNKSGSNRTTAAAPGGELLESLAAPRDDSVDEISVVGEKNTATSAESLVVPVDDSVNEILVVGEKNRATPPETLVAPVDDTVTEILAVGENNPVIRVSIDASPMAPSSPPVRHLNSVTETEIRRYRRTESERFEENRERGKLRRSKTEIHREDGGEPARLLNSVEEMDIDDFNRTVESFIAEQKLHIGGRISV